MGEWRLPGLLCVDILVLCCEWKENLRMRFARFVELCKTSTLELLEDKRKVLVW